MTPGSAGIKPHRGIHAPNPLECGKVLQLLSHRHLALHGLTPETYTHKYDLPPGLMLCASTLAERRRHLAQQKRGSLP